MTVGRLAQVLGLCGVAALGILLMIACTPLSPSPSWPPPTPALLGVDDVISCEIPPGSAGEFRLLPRQEIVLRLAAAAWAELAVAANGTELERIVYSDRDHMNRLKAAGTGYWGAIDMDVNLSPPAWKLVVGLPLSMQQGPVTLTFFSRKDGQSTSPLTVKVVLTENVVTDMHATSTTPHRVDLDWRGRGDELGYLLERSMSGGSYTPLASLGKGAPGYTDVGTTGNRHYSYRLTAQHCGTSSSSQVVVTTPKKTDGFHDLVLSEKTNDEPLGFVYKGIVFVGPEPLNVPEDAIVTGVTNTSTEIHNDGVKLGSVRHTDRNGVPRSLPAANCPNAPLEPQGSTSVFNGQTASGEWKVQATCLSVLFLDTSPGDIHLHPASISLHITWSQ